MTHRGPCPLHGGRNKRAFVIDPKNDTWRCFGDCDRGGGTLEFVAAHESCSLIEAAQMLARWFSIAPEASYPRRRTMSGGKPSHKVFTVEDRQGDADDESGFWTRIGSAWPHKDGKGLNVVLSALPVNGRLVLREYTEKDAEEDDRRAKARTGRR